MEFKDKYNKIYSDFYNLSKDKKPFMEICFIYKIQNKKTKKIYIGRSIYGAKQRFKSHLEKANNITSDVYLNPFQEDIRKYGKDCFHFENIDCIIIHKKEYSKANDLELSYIKKYNSLFPNGYNLTGLKRAEIKKIKGRK